MNPIAFTVFGIDIRWYGIIISSGILMGIILAKYTCSIKKIDYNKFLDIILISIVSGVIGARLYYVIFKFNYYSNHLGEIIKIRNGGLAIHGGLIFGILAAFIYIRKHRLDFLRYADVAAPSIILAQAIGRWGNFFNQEAHGGLVSYEFIKHFPDFIQKGMYINGMYYNPTFLYESLWNMLIFLMLIVILLKVQRKGIVFFTYIGMYSIGRFIIEGMRDDSLMLGPLKMAQVVSLLVIIVSIAFLIKAARESTSRIE